MQTQQVVTLPSNSAGSVLPPVAVTLQSITPHSGEAASDQKLCPTAPTQTHCSRQISAITGVFTKYTNPAKPIKITIKTRWGTSVPPRRILMEKNSGGDPLFLLACAINPVTHAFKVPYNTPCHGPETVSGTSGADNLTTTDTICFTGLDVHFARRVSTGGTVIKAPAAPTAVTATSGSAAATVTWKAPTVTNGAGVTSYVVTALVEGVVKKTVTHPSPSLAQTITGLTNGTTYTFKVAAGNVAGTGVASTISAAVKVGTPLAPTAVTATVANASVTLHWTAPKPNGTPAVNGYVVTPYVGTIAKPAHPYGTATAETITGLTNGTTYTFKVAAKNTVGTGPQSTASAAVKPT